MMMHEKRNRWLVSFILLTTLAAKGTIVSAPSFNHQSRDNTNADANAFVSPAVGYVVVNGIRIRYLEWDHKGPPVLLLHGMNDSAQIWREIAPILASDCHVIAPDRRGTGESDKPQEGYDFKTLARDVILMLENMKLSQVTLVGHSFGAELALHIAAQNPELIHSVIMVDGGFWPKRVLNPARASSPIEKASSEYDPELLYPRISCPVLLVFAHGSGPGEQALAELKKQGIDYLEEVSKAERGAKDLADRKLRHAQFASVENSGHWIQVDQPQALAKVIKQFLIY